LTDILAYVMVRHKPDSPFNWSSFQSKWDIQPV